MSTLSQNHDQHPTHQLTGSAYLAATFKSLYNDHSWLTLTGCLMLADMVLSIVGLIADPSVITGAPAWLKPLKFAISTGLFSFTVAWMIGRLHKTRRLAAWIGRFMASSLTLEIILIDMQAARHTTSHFNTALPFDRAVYGIMGMGIAIVFLATTLLLAATLFEKFPDRSLGYSIRLSLVLALAGMSTGAMMSIPTPQQLTAAHAGLGLPRTGAHTVGAPDGGPGLPFTGWSADHGDLRIAHFVGLHAMQVLILAWGITGGWASAALRWSQKQQSRLVWALAFSLAAAYATLLVQALRGQSFLHPDSQIAISWATTAVLTAALLFWAASSTNQTTASFKENA